MWSFARWLNARVLPRLGARACLLCLGPASGTICERCQATFPGGGIERCLRCALPTSDASDCRRCQINPPGFDTAIAAFDYAYPVDRIIHALKYGHRLALAGWCAERIAETVRHRAALGSREVALVPMPSTASRSRARGFDPAWEIGRALAGVLALPAPVRTAWRTVDRPPQASLPWRARAANVAGAFGCARLQPGIRTVIVDDVLTTGASAGELARSLRTAGAGRVDVWVVARTPPPVDR